MAVTLPDIGRNGLVNSVRRLSGLTNPGYRKVEPTAEFIAGNVAKLVDNGAGPVLDVADANDKTIVGIFYCNKTTNFYRPIVDEEQTFATSPNTAWAVYTNHANIKTGSIKVYNVTDTIACTVSIDYTITSLTNGIITRTSTGNIGAAHVIEISYLYEDPNLSGIDQTLGSGMAATLEDHGEIATLVYDSSVNYALMGPLYSTATGYLTSYSGGGGGIVGYVTKVPTSEDPELQFKLAINNA